jgi:aldoxime dehydratase
MSDDNDMPSRPRPLPPRAQRWGAVLAPEVKQYFVACYGVQIKDGPDAAKALQQSPFFKWVDMASTSRYAPGASDHSRYVDGQGFLCHVYMCYWTNETRFKNWCDEKSYLDFWDSEQRQHDATGCWREEMTVPISRQETVYFYDWIQGIGLCEGVSIEKAKPTGAYGTMRKRIADPHIDGYGDSLPQPEIRQTAGARIQVHIPEFFAVIRSWQLWARCGKVQRKDFLENLQPALNAGMLYIRDNPADSGCCTVRYMRNCDVSGKQQEQTSGLAYFLNIEAMENWASRHASHEKIYVIAKKHLKDPTYVREFRTCHEVFVLPEKGQRFEYINCQPMTGVLPYFEVVCKAK